MTHEALHVGLIQTGASSAPWKEGLAVLAFVAVAMWALLRERMRGKPTTFVTGDDRALDNATRETDKKEIMAGMVHLEDKFDRLSLDVRDFKNNCASLKDVNDVGTKVSHMEKDLAVTREKAEKAQGRSVRALHEVKEVRGSLDEVKASIAMLHSKVDPIRDSMIRIEEHLKTHGNDHAH